MNSQDIDDIYGRFAAIWANSHRLVDKSRLAAAVLADDKQADEVTNEWLRALSNDWVYRQSEQPFGDDKRNRRYRAIFRSVESRI